MTVSEAVDKLIDYSEKNLELDARDSLYVRNSLLDALGCGTYAASGALWEGESVGDLLGALTDACAQAGLPAEDTESLNDRVMGMLMLPPHAVQDRFREELEKSPEEAMKWFYDYSVLGDYVKKEKLDRNPRYTAKNGLIITINLAKPEFRDPKRAASGNSTAGGYPACTICRDNEGYGPRNKRTLRTVPLTLGGEPWFWQFSPYGYFFRHGIAVNTKHTPMHVDRATFGRLMDFVDAFPCFFLGSNAPLPRIGGSVLAHDHFQGGQENLPLFSAKPAIPFRDDSAPGAKISVLDWYSTAIRVEGTREEVTEVSEKIRAAWVSFRDESRSIIPYDADGIHSAVSPTCRKTESGYVMDILLRNNITSPEFPDGIFHAHPEYHVIKKESIGLIEAQGLFILPGRLQKELAPLSSALAEGKGLPAGSEAFQVVWDRLDTSKPYTAQEAETAVFEALGDIAEHILKNTAVFKTHQETADFLRGAGLHEI